MLRQLDHFDLRDSRISFLTPAGARAEFDIPQLTWLSGRDRHRAEGQISLSTLNGQHGVVQLRMDLRDNQGLLDTGTVYLQADNIDMKPGLPAGCAPTPGWKAPTSARRPGCRCRTARLPAATRCSSRGGQLGYRRRAAPAGRGQSGAGAAPPGTGWQLDVPQLRLSTDGRPAAGHAFRPVAAGKYRVHGAGAE